MKKLKVMTVVGTRPEIIRLSRVMAALDVSPAIEHITVHTGQNYDYELNEVFYEDLGIRKPDYFLNAAGATATATVGQILINIDPLLEKVQPDAFLVLGDTNSCLCAIPAKKRHIPIFHMEAGNRCFDQRVPEETNRKIVDHISDINLTYSDIAREYLLREGLSADRIIKTGSPMFEVLNHYMPKIQASDVLERMGLEKGKYFVVSAHREENISNDKNFFGLLESLNQIAEKYQYPIIVSTHPRTRKRLEQLSASSTQLSAISGQLSAISGQLSAISNQQSAIRGQLSDSSDQLSANGQQPSIKSDQSTAFRLHPLIQWQKPMGFSDYNALQINAFAVLSDSGTISEESSIMNFRALNIREAHERPEAMEETSVMMVGLNPIRIMQGLAQLENQSIGLRPSQVNNQLSAISYQLSAVSHQPSAISDQTSAISDQTSAISDQTSAISDQTSAISNQQLAIGNQQTAATTFRSVSDYSMPNVSEKVVRIILSYTDYIKRVVWSE